LRLVAFRRETDLAIIAAGLAAALNHAIGLHVPFFLLWDVTRISNYRSHNGGTKEEGQTGKDHGMD
jgi:hypothetical protein